MMRVDSDVGDEAASRLVCRQVVQALIEQYGWTLLSEDHLVALTLASRQAGTPPLNLESQVKRHYIEALYEACWQAEDLARRDRGYTELFRVLFRVAYNHWPDLAEDATQRALLLVYQQLDHCRHPATFLAFVLNKLRQAFKEEQRARGKETPQGFLDDFLLEKPGQPIVTALQSILSIRLGHADHLCVLVNAIERLPNPRQQKAILWKYMGGLSDEEIATRLEVTPVNVRKLRHDGLARLRQDTQLQAYFGADGE